MQVHSINSLSFQRRLKDAEKAEYIDVLKQAKEKVGNKGISALIVPSTSLPHKLSNNSGCGNLLNKESQEFFDFAKLYWGVNCVQLLPEGVHSHKCNTYKPYSGSSLDLGMQVINLDLLTQDNFGKLLSKQDVDEVIAANKNPDKDIHINLENTMEKNSPTEKALRKAYDELLKGDTKEKQSILNKLENYTADNREWLDRKSIYKALELKNGTKRYDKWNKIDGNLFNEEIVPIEKRTEVINELCTNPTYKKEMSFYTFTQFLADEHLALAKEELNKKGLKLSGDMVVGCSYDEKWMFPKAFYKEERLPYGLHALNFNENDGLDFLRMKVRNNAKRYDALRVDASWLYANQKLVNGEDYSFTNYLDEILNIIDDEVLKVKGKDYNLQNITHEFMASPYDYTLEEAGILKEEARDRVKIFTTQHMSDTWCSLDNFKKRGWKEDTLIMGPTNHDNISLKDLYKNETARKEQTEVLAKILKIPEKKLQSLSGFIQAKFAEPIRSFHNMFFFADALNLDESYAKDGHDKLCYRLKIPENYQDKYFADLEKGEGLNIMDALGKAFVAEGLDKTEPDLYKKIIKYRDILSGAEKKKSRNKWIIGAASVITLAIIGAIAIHKHKNSKETPKEQTV